jgi:hypothetical protein
MSRSRPRQRVEARRFGTLLADLSRARRVNPQPARLRGEYDLCEPVARPLPSLRQQLIAAELLAPADDPGGAHD